MDESKWAVRKIRKGGRVKIDGKWFRPEEVHMQYDGRMDGYVYLFGRYKSYRHEGYEPFLDCWGLAENRRRDPDEWVHGPELVDGCYPWAWWREEGTQNANSV